MYVNPRLVVTTLPVTDAGEIVLIKRGIEPGLGEWAQPGGFLEVDETVHQAAIRETWEETGLLVEPGEIVGLYTRLEAAVVTIAFEARIVGGTPAPTPEATEIQAYAPEAIPWPDIAFRTTTWALRDWLDRRRPDLHLAGARRTVARDPDSTRSTSRTAPASLKTVPPTRPSSPSGGTGRGVAATARGRMIRGRSAGRVGLAIAIAGTDAFGAGDGAGSEAGTAAGTAATSSTGEPRPAMASPTITARPMTQAPIQSAGRRGRPTRSSSNSSSPTATSVSSGR